MKRSNALFVVNKPFHVAAFDIGFVLQEHGHGISLYGVCGFVVGHCHVECAPTPGIYRICSNLVNPKQQPHTSHPQYLIVSGGAHKGSREAVAVANSVCEGPGLWARIRTACARISIRKKITSKNTCVAELGRETDPVEVSKR